MRKLRSVFAHRFGPVAVVILAECGLSFITRLALFVKSLPNLDLTFLNVAGIFLVGLLFDVIVGLFLSIPVAIYCWALGNRAYRSKWQQVPLFGLVGLLICIMIIVAASEIAFWQEFNVRFNFIAVDYLIYTNEVLGSVWESYNFTMILTALTATVGLLLLSVRKLLIRSQEPVMSFRRRSIFLAAYLVLPLAAYFLANTGMRKFSHNNYVNELGGNGLYEFASSFEYNEISYDQFYASRSNDENFMRLRKLLESPNARFTGDSLSIEREISYPEPEQRHNVLLISVESLSADYLGFFGNKEGITPHLDSLIPRSLLFKNFYASGTRTVRGLEALSLGIPPTPGQSIVRRPNNENMFTLGSVFRSKGYDVHFIYGGNSFFDNMGYFFSHSGYDVKDVSDIPQRLVSHSTAWGVDDEATLSYTLEQCRESYKKRRPFFNHVMTVSNHRPYTYPEGRIDISPKTHTAAGAVKYTDFALHRFLQAAAKEPWFANTIFVMVADHCSRSAGKMDLPVNRYHIPCIVYAPGLIEPGVESKLTSQIDLPPTILGMLNMRYTSRFFGIDVLNTAVPNDRVFISTYQNLGYLKDDKLVILSPHQKVASYKPDFLTGTGTKIPDADSLTNEAIAWYEGASYLFHQGKYKAF